MDQPNQQIVKETCRILAKFLENKERRIILDVQQNEIVNDDTAVKRAKSKINNKRRGNNFHDEEEEKVEEPLRKRRALTEVSFENQT